MVETTIIQHHGSTDRSVPPRPSPRWRSRGSESTSSPRSGELRSSFVVEDLGVAVYSSNSFHRSARSKHSTTNRRHEELEHLCNLNTHGISPISTCVDPIKLASLAGRATREEGGERVEKARELSQTGEERERGGGGGGRGGGGGCA
jgi:hypothetical protein